MKKTLIVLALGSLALTACSSSSDSKPATQFDIENFKPVELQSETRLADSNEFAQEFSKSTGGNTNCNQKAFDVSLRNANFKIEETAISAQGSFSSKKNVSVTSVTAEEVHMNASFDRYEVSVLPGVQIYENNQAQITCKLDSTSGSTYPKCETTGEYTQAVKNYLASQGKSSEESRTTHCHSESQDKGKSIYSKGVFVLEDGTKVPVLVSKSQNVSTEICDGQAAKKTISSTISIMSTSVLPYPDGSSLCGGGRMYSRYVSQTENFATTNDYTFKTLRAPRK